VQTDVACLCADGHLGKFCELDSSGCILDAYGDCCPAGRLLSINGACCDNDQALDEDAVCCAKTDHDACGVCGGRGLFVDSMGVCCPVAAADANGACCFGTVDQCGAGVPAASAGGTHLGAALCLVPVHASALQVKLLRMLQASATETAHHALLSLKLAALCGQTMSWTWS
jgi:hypothetical protein